MKFHNCHHTNPGTNPSMAHEFTTAAYRFGHSMIQGIIRLYATDNSGFTGLVFPKNEQKYLTKSQISHFALTAQQTEAVFNKISGPKNKNYPELISMLQGFQKCIA